MPLKAKPPQAKPKAPAPDGLTYTVEQAGSLLGLSRASAYTAASKGEIPTVRIGKRVLVPRIALQRLLEAAFATA